jgi:hypothetical protein
MLHWLVSVKREFDAEAVCSIDRSIGGQNSLNSHSGKALDHGRMFDGGGDDCFRLVRNAFATPKMARLFASVAQPVDTVSDAVAPINIPTSARARSTASCACLRAMG